MSRVVARKETQHSLSGPGAYNTDAPLATGKPAPGGQKTTSADRYAILQRKLEDLERIHAEGKKSVRHAAPRTLYTIQAP